MEKQTNMQTKSKAALVIARIYTSDTVHLHIVVFPYNIMYAYKTLLPKTKIHLALLLYNIAHFGNFVLKICIKAKYIENKR